MSTAGKVLFVFNGNKIYEATQLGTAGKALFIVDENKIREVNSLGTAGATILLLGEPLSIQELVPVIQSLL